MKELLYINKECYEEVIAHTKEGFPDEACGILAGNDSIVSKVYKMVNADQSPLTYFMDPKELFQVVKDIRNNNFEMLAIYHSHTASEAYPSATDIKSALYPDSLYVIVSLREFNSPKVRAFHIDEGNVTEKEIRILDKENQNGD
ncbi:MAG: M67 family metallopeptidase [Actinobacteria bacterium]|nr:M67 family metallopeptidase [Actinomycetota bacterium]